jgi:hypothetical protein
MKRTLICALVLLAVTASANAASLWLESGGTMNAKVNIPGVGEKAQVDLYMDFTDDNTVGFGVGAPPEGRALMVSLSVLLRLFPHSGWNPVPAPLMSDGVLHAKWQDYANDIPNLGPEMQSTNGMDLVSRKSFVDFGNQNVNSYSLIYQAHVEGGTPYHYSEGFAASAAYTRIKVDHLVVEGISLTAPDSWDHLFIPQEQEPYGDPSDFQPSWQEGRVLASGTVTGVADRTFTNLSPNVGYTYGGLPMGTEHILIKVTPEPAALALLALGGLVALRRRR